MSTASCRSGGKVLLLPATLAVERTEGLATGQRYDAFAKRISAGAIFDVIVDLPEGFSTFGRTWSIELAAESHAALYMPKGFAHGFQTQALENRSALEMRVRLHPNAARDIRWKDPELGNVWPASTNERLVSQPDNDLPMLADWKAAGI